MRPSCQTLRQIERDPKGTFAVTILLGVNVDHVATLRQARGTAYPDPVEAARQALDSGADYITVHLREDRRHIQERDVGLLRQTVHRLLWELSEDMAGSDPFPASWWRKAEFLLPSEKEPWGTAVFLFFGSLRDFVHVTCADNRRSLAQLEPN